MFLVFIKKLFFKVFIKKHVSIGVVGGMVAEKIVVKVADSEVVVVEELSNAVARLRRR